MSLHLLRCGDAKKIHVAATTPANVPFRMDWPTLLRGTWDDTNNISTPSRAPLLSRSASSHSCIFTVRATAPSRTRKYAASASLSYVSFIVIRGDYNMFCFATFRAIHRKLEKTHYMLIRATGLPGLLPRSLFSLFSTDGRRWSCLQRNPKESVEQQSSRP